MTYLRTDIQVLRGLSVAMVVAFHAWGEVFAKGYLGVDVFFVISGFLVTGMILRGLERGDFRFVDFYARRARRLLPATVSTLVFTTLIAVLLLTTTQMREYAAQLLGALTFSANVVLALQSGYFEAAAESKPLLHIWSLSLEEQFYFVAPLILWATPRQARGALLALGAGLSLLLCLLLTAGPGWLPVTSAAAQKLAFFMLPSRAWELLAGAGAAWLVLRRPNIAIPAWANWAALTAIVLVCALGLDPIHPRGDAVLVVVATCVILLGDRPWLPDRLPTRLLAKLGDWSFSVYLVHWPLFAFAHVIYGGQAPLWVMTGLAAISLVLAWAQYAFVEQPFRERGPRLAPRWLAMGVAAAGLGFAAMPALTAQPKVEISPSHGFDAACDQREQAWRDIEACRNGSDPRVAVWGDSYAMHLVPGLRDLPIVQMTRSACAPLLGLAQFGGSLNEDWARSCIDFNEGVMQSIKARPSIDVVVLSSPFTQVLADNGQRLVRDGVATDWDQNQAESHLVRTVESLQRLGRTVIIVAPTPDAGFNAGTCNERRVEGRWSLDRASCDFAAIEADPKRQAEVERLLEVGRRAGAVVINPAAALCHNGLCRTSVDGDVLYVDGGHLTAAGSQYVAEGTGLRGLIVEEIR